MRHLLFTLFLILLRPASLWAADVIYTPQDSIKVEKLLRDGLRRTSTTPLTLYYAQQLLGLPYVAHTLEVSPTEKLIINLREMDCTTLVENVVALSLTTHNRSTRFHDFCYWLKRIRYRDGHMDGYASRNHYFSQWIVSNEALGIVNELKGNQKNTNNPFTATQVIDAHFMSQHPKLYTMIATSPKGTLELIQKYEKEVSGKTIRYIPNASLNKGKKKLGCIQDGDILCLVTKIDGLEISHLGIAVWGKDGKLHLLNASSLKHKVILDDATLYDYMNRQKNNLGVRVVRLKL